MFYDITASAEGQGLFTDILRQTASRVFIPLTVGAASTPWRTLTGSSSAGADKVSVNSGAIRNPDLIRQAALRYGSQCVVLSADVKRVDGQFRSSPGRPGRHGDGGHRLDPPLRGPGRAGEVVVNSIDTDGVKGALTWRCWPPCARR